MKILIAYDGSDSSLEALDDLHRAGLPPEAEVLVVTASGVALPDPPPAGGETTQGLHGSRRVKTALAKTYEHALKVTGEAHARALAGADRVRRDFPGWEVSAEALQGDPVAALLGKAEGWGADLVVVGSRGRGSLRRLVGRSVSTKVAREARCSVRVVRQHDGAGGPRPQLLVGVDGTRDSRAAVAAVAGRRWPLGTRVRLVTCVKPFGRYAPSPNRQHAAAEAVLREAARLMKDVETEAAVLEGEAEQALAREARKWKATCVFVGSGSKRGFERLMLGSVSAALVKNAPCTVEVVRGREGVRGVTPDDKRLKKRGGAGSSEKGGASLQPEQGREGPEHDGPAVNHSRAPRGDGPRTELAPEDSNGKTIHKQ